jgi:hypothetical protein
VVGRRHAATAFRPSAPVGRSTTPSRVQSFMLLLGVVAIAAGLAIASFVVKPSKARSFDLFYGSMYINDNASPVSVDLASGKPTVRLRDAFKSVSAASTGELDVIALDGANTLMLNPTTGEFNMVDSTGFVVKPTGGGVRLPTATGVTRTSAIPSGDSAYMLQSSDSRSSIFLVNQATVSSAIGTNARAKARAYFTINAPVADQPAQAVSANGDLWLLTGAGDAHTITQLSVPAGSNAGVILADQAQGTVSGISAVGVATRTTDGTGGDVPAVASARQVQVFAGAKPAELPVKIDGTVTEILPASNAEGELSFLYRTAAGWSRVTAPASGIGSAQVTKLTAIDPNARLVTPAASDGHVYTMDAATGDLWQIDANGSAHPIVGAGTYPILPGEKLDLSQAEVLARGSRVIFNARANYEAVVVFSDGSHAPRTIDKHSAVQVDPTGATTLADAHSKTTKPGTKPTKPTKTTTPRPAQQVNDKIDCKTTTVKPNIPTIRPGDRGARSVVVTWTYPLIENTDCIPSTYVVSIKVLTDGAPSVPSKVTVRGQNGVTLTGLFPATQYELTVTAYLNKLSTTSQPIRVSTGPEGPAAATNVHASPTSSGDWTISWNSCGGIQQGCVPSTEWNIIPKFCDDRGLSNVPPPLSVAEDPSVHSFTRTYPGNDGLLGRGLCFAVQGVSPQGTNGTVSDFTSAAYSWSPPIASTLKLTASQPANTALGATASTSVNLDLGANPVRDVGGLGATITFTLTGPGGAKTKTVTFDGKSEDIASMFPGIQAGAQYTARATVHPPNHSSVSASTAVVTVTTRANWPSLSAQASCPDGGGPIVLSCTLTVRIDGIASAAAGGERFSLTDTSNVVCGSSGFQLNKSNFDPAHEAITENVNLLAFNGTCTVNLALREGAGARDPEVFGGTTSPSFSTGVNLGRASTLDAGQSDFTAAWGTRTDPLNNKISGTLLKYVGSRTDNQTGQVSSNWAESLTAPDGTQCGRNNAQATHDGVFVDLSGACLNQFGGQNGWHLTLSYSDKSNGGGHSFSYTLNGTPPNYHPPCTVAAANFAANWAGTPDAPAVTIDFDSHATALEGCSGWSYQLFKNEVQSCGTTAGPAPDAGQVVVAATCDTTTLAVTWRIQITYDSDRGDARPISISVGGDPPVAPPTSPPPDPTPTPTGS